jgi:Aminoglycoside-2''-adenylyltransferase
VGNLSDSELERLYGRWEPLTPQELVPLFDGAPFRWWIAGGWATEACGAPPRKHADIDVVVLFDDLPAIRSWLSDFHLWEAHAGTLRPLLPGDELRAEREGVWVRRDADHPWFFDLLLTRTEDGRWLFKRDARISLPLDDLGRTIRGIPYLRPSVVLLHKAKALREKDQADFEGILPVLDDNEREWLDNALAIAHPDHPWRVSL